MISVVTVYHKLVSVIHGGMMRDVCTCLHGGCIPNITEFVGLLAKASSYRSQLRAYDDNWLM